MHRILTAALFVLLAIPFTAHASIGKTHYHKVKTGESLSKIAQRYHTGVSVLCRMNGIGRGHTLKAGEKLKVPRLKISHKKKHHFSKAKKHTEEKRLAKALVHIKRKSPITVKIKKAHKLTLNDIVYYSNGFNGKLSAKSQRIIELAKQKLGRRYVWGAAGQRNTFDCSGLTSYVCKVNGIHLPRRAIQQSKVGKPIKRSELQPGDLVFFDTSKHRKGYVNHVGIYIGNGKFIHASSAKKRVIITSLNKPFYSQRFKGARRVASL